MLDPVIYILLYCAQVTLLNLHNKLTQLLSFTHWQLRWWLAGLTQLARSHTESGWAKSVREMNVHLCPSVMGTRWRPRTGQSIQEKAASPPWKTKEALQMDMSLRLSEPGIKTSRWFAAWRGLSRQRKSRCEVTEAWNSLEPSGNSRGEMAWAQGTCGRR